MVGERPSLKIQTDLDINFGHVHWTSPLIATIGQNFMKRKLDHDKSIPDVELVVYDFDQTLSCQHIFNYLRQITPFGGSQGQVDALKHMNHTDVMRLFGDQKRLDRLHHHFDAIKQNGNNVTMIILSNGYQDVVNTALDMTGLSQYFQSDHIIARDTLQFEEAFANGGKWSCIEEIKNKLNLSRTQVCNSFC